MTTFTQKTSETDFGGRPLPFQSKEDVNQQMDRNSHPLCASVTKGKGSLSSTYPVNDGKLSTTANKGDVRSWLDSTCPTSALGSAFTKRQNVDLHPPTPSPVCSPSAASTPLSSPSVSTEQQDRQRRHLSLANIDDARGIDRQARLRGRKLDELTSAIKRDGKYIFNEAPPDSPTESIVSSGSEGGLLALLASKLLSYKENGRPYSRYAREISGPIEEKHVVEDRSQKPPVEDNVSATTTRTHLHPQNSDGDNVGWSSALYRAASAAVSELSIGSANDRTLSMEFDAMLANAAATGIHQATSYNEQHLQHLPEIQEGLSVARRTGAAQQNNADVRAIMRVGDEQQMINDDEAGRLARALTVMRQGLDSEDMDFNNTLSAILVSRTSASQGRVRGEAEENTNWQRVPTTTGVPVEVAEVDRTLAHRNRETFLESASYGSNGENRLAMVLKTHATSPGDFSLILSSSSADQCKEKNMKPTVPMPASQALEKVRRDRVFAQAMAYQDAKCSKCNNRYKREESRIAVWENQQKIKASLRMKKVEMRLEQKRAKAVEKMQNEIARAHKIAEERKASAEAVRAAKTARILQKTDVIRKAGKSPSTASAGCFPF